MRSKKANNYKKYQHIINNVLGKIKLNLSRIYDNGQESEEFLFKIIAQTEAIQEVAYELLEEQE